MAPRWVDHEPGRLVHDEKVLVLVDNVQRNRRVWLGGGERWRFGIDLDARPKGDLSGGAFNLPIDPHAAVLNPAGHDGAGLMHARVSKERNDELVEAVPRMGGASCERKDGHYAR
jgi:hypothetical protein